MSIGAGVALCANVSGTLASPGVEWKGGKASLAVCATTYDTTCFLQVQLMNGAWANVNAAAYTANSINQYDLPAGQYRMNLGTTTAGLYASLLPVFYG